MAIHQVIYCSTPTRVMGNDEINRLVAQMRAHNLTQAVTGMLFYSGEQFVQLLEGESRAVGELYAHIGHDPRHAALTTVLDQPAPGRLFPQWSMGFGHVDPAPLARLVGYLHPLHRAALLPSSCNAQEVFADLLCDFVAEYALRPHGPTEPRRRGASWLPVERKFGHAFPRPVSVGP